jgi:hypothetical protein
MGVGSDIAVAGSHLFFYGHKTGVGKWRINEKYFICMSIFV